MHELETTLQEKRRRTKERERELESTLQAERERLNERLHEEERAVSKVLAENHSLKALVVMLEEQVCLFFRVKERGAGSRPVSKRTYANQISKCKRYTCMCQAERLNLSIHKEDGKNKTLVRSLDVF